MTGKNIQTLAPGEPGIRLSIGTSGAGKTYGLRRDVYSAARAGTKIIVIDRMQEWTHGDVFVSTVPEAIAALAGKARLAIVSRDGMDAAADVEAACKWAGERRQRGLVRGVAFAEAHNVAPSMSRLSPALMDVVTQWRHRESALWVDTQRIALLSRTITEQSRVIRCYAVIGDRDRDTLAGLGGPALVRAIDTCVERLAAGEPGYHVELGLVRVPRPDGTYEVKR